MSACGCGPGADRKVVVSTGSLPRLADKPYWDMSGIGGAAEALGSPPLELVLLPEWDASGPPVTSHNADLDLSQRIGMDRIFCHAVELARRFGVPSVHASRDVGPLLGSDSEAERRRGRRQLREACDVARAVGAGQVVVHAWDTFAAVVDPHAVAARLAEVTLDQPAAGLVISIEGVPVSVPGWSPVRMAAAVAVELEAEAAGAQGFRTGVTVDLNWVSQAGDLEDCFAASGSRFSRLGATGGGGIVAVTNIHVHGSVVESADNCEVRPLAGNLDFGGALRRLSAGYPRAQLTLELSGLFRAGQACGALRWARSCSGAHQLPR
ncbi:MAG: hypothetical protein Q8P31_10330 [Bacillota bacterium]|nr:hypothetical protein [Bacillota bacterium]